jgi:hypothetical protein
MLAKTTTPNVNEGPGEGAGNNDDGQDEHHDDQGANNGNNDDCWTNIISTLLLLDIHSLNILSISHSSKH